MYNLNILWTCSHFSKAIENTLQIIFATGRLSVQNDIEFASDRQTVEQTNPTTLVLDYKLGTLVFTNITDYLLSLGKVSH